MGYQVFALFTFSEGRWMRLDITTSIKIENNES